MHTQTHRHTHLYLYTNIHVLEHTQRHITHACAHISFRVNTDSLSVFMSASVCSSPRHLTPPHLVTGKSCVDLIITELAVFEVHRQEGLTLIEKAEGVSVDDIRAKTEAPFKVSLATITTTTNKQASQLTCLTACLLLAIGMFCVVLCCVVLCEDVA